MKRSGLNVSNKIKTHSLLGDLEFVRRCRAYRKMQGLQGDVELTGRCRAY
jgi:hypothetical protein